MGSQGRQQSRAGERRRRRRAKVRAGAVGLLVGLAGVVWFAAPATAAADGCEAGVESDFNGDGRSDTVIGDPWATISGNAQAGRINVLYGDADGLIGEGSRDVLWQGEENVGGVAEAGDRFGFSLSVADINCDQYTDLVVGSPWEDINGQADSGYVQVLWGGAAGLAIDEASTQYTQTNFGRTIVAGDQFGYAVDAMEDVGQGGTGAPDAYALAIGAPGADVSGRNDAGWVGFRVACDGGNIYSEVTQDTPGIPGAAEVGDRFGAAISLNYLRGSAETVDAVIGVPNEDVGTLADAGAISVVTDVYCDEFDGGMDYDQNSAGVPGSAEAGDVFGRTLDTVRVGNTSRLAVGVPGEDLGSASNAGMVQLFSSNRTTVTIGTGLSQDTAGVGGVAESGDGFGNRLAFAAPGLGDTATRLGVGVPNEDGAGADSGWIQVFPMNDLDGETTYSQTTAGVPGVEEAGDKFGNALAFVSGATERAWIIGVADDAYHSNGLVNIIPQGGGAGRYWAPGYGGISGAGASRFGDALGSATGTT